MANPYRGREGGRIDSGEPRTVSRPVAARPKAGGRPSNNGQPTFPVGMAPLPPGLGSPSRGIDQGLLGPLAPGGPGGGAPAGPGPGNPITGFGGGAPGFGPGGPANVAQGGAGGSMADSIINDTTPGRKNEQKGGK